MSTRARSLLLFGVLLSAAGWAIAQGPGPKLAPGCYYGSIFFGQTLDASWGPEDCSSGAPANRIYDYHLFSAAAGQRVTATLSYANPALSPASIAIKTLDGLVLGFGSGPSPIAVSETLPASGYYVILVQSVTPFGYGDYSLSLKASAETGGCSLGACLNGGRFQVTATWTKSDGSTGAAVPAMFTNDTGYFWFFDASNVELVIKVLEANGKFWVFASGLTNVGVDIVVVDTATGVAKTYRNPVGSAFQPIQDTSGFTAPVQNANVQGVWDGTVRMASGAEETMMLTLAQAGTAVTGTAALQGGGVGAAHLVGSVSGQTLTFTVTDTSDSCTSTFTGSGIVDDTGTRISGAFGGGDCVGASSGTFTAARR